MHIEFSKLNGTYGAFSNFAKTPFLLEDKIWPTSEHYYQAQKFLGTARVEEIRLAKSAHDAAQMGRDPTFKVRSDWESLVVPGYLLKIKDAVMWAALRAKFTSNNQLKELLLSTNLAVIVERSDRDSYWGDGKDRNGENMLGKLLMKVRQELRNFTPLEY